MYICHRKTANRHFLKSMARVGAGSEEFFDCKTKSKWQRKVITRTCILSVENTFPRVAFIGSVALGYVSLASSNKSA